MVAMINEGLMRAMVAVAGLRARLAESEGQGVLEYAMLGGLIAGGLAAAFLFAGLDQALNDMAGGIAECINFDDVCP